MFAVAPLRLAFAVGLTASFVHAQSTWIVDAAGGPGSNFTTLTAAFAAATHGDTVIVRAGSYGVATLDQAIRLVGEPGATVTQVPNGAPMRIENLGAGLFCSVRGLTITGSAGIFFNGPSGLVIANCAGSVVLDDMMIDARSSQGGLLVEQCTSVAVNGSTVRSRLEVHGSRFTATESSFLAYTTVSLGVFADGSTLEFSQCNVQGSEGGGHAPAGDGIRASNSHVVIRGDVNSSIRGGLYIFGSFVAYSVNGMGSSTLELDPDVTLSRPPNGLLSIETRDMALLTVDGGQGGGTVDITLRSEPGDPYGLMLALPGQPIDLGPFGTLWLHAPSIGSIQGGVLDATGELSLSLPLPVNPGNVGLGLQFQALTNGSTFEFTNAPPLVLY